MLIKIGKGTSCGNMIYTKALCVDRSSSGFELAKWERGLQPSLISLGLSPLCMAQSIWPYTNAVGINFTLDIFMSHFAFSRL